MKNETPEQREARLEYGRKWRAEKKKSDPGYWQRNYEKHKDTYVQWSKDNAEESRKKYAEYYKSDKCKASMARTSAKWRNSTEGKRYAVFDAARRRTKIRQATSENTPRRN